MRERCWRCRFPEKGVPICCDRCERLVPTFLAGPDGDRDRLCRRCAEADDFMAGAIPRLCESCDYAIQAADRLVDELGLLAAVEFDEAEAPA